MEKVNVEQTFLKAPESKPMELPASFKAEGWGTLETGNGAAKVVRFRREDGLLLTLFADQLRQEGGKLFVMADHFAKQLERAELWMAKRAAAPKL